MTHYTRERDGDRERGGARHGCQWAEREKKSCTLVAVARVTVSRQRRQKRRDKARMLHLLDAEKLLKLC